MRKKKEKEKQWREIFNYLILEGQTELALYFLSLFGTILRVVKIKLVRKEEEEKTK